MNEISIIIPVYNTPLYLGECLESVLAQGVEDMEIIVINDCSTDSTPEIIDDYAKRDKRIKPIHLDKNIGVGPARNIGIASAKGTWLAMIDSDDIMQENSLARLLETARAYNSDVIVGYVNVQRDNVDGTYEIETFKWSQDVNFTVANTNLDCCPALINVSSCWSLIYNRKFLIDSGIVFRRRMQEDADFVLNTLLQAERVSVRGDVPYIRYRMRYINKTDLYKSITQSEWSPERFDMMVDHLNTVMTLFSSDVYVEKYKNIEQLRKTRLSHYFGRFVNSILNCILRLDEYGDYLNSLEMTASLFEQSGLRETGFDSAVQTLEPSSHLANTGYYELALNLLLERRWSTLAILLENKALEVQDVARIAKVGSLSPALQSSLQVYIKAPIRSLICSENWQPRLLPHTVKEVTLHIGMTKTGSTAIQNFLERNRELLCENRILYPQTGLHFETRSDSKRTSGHQYLMLASKRRDTDFFARVFSEITTTPNIRKVIISTENMFLDMSATDIEKLHKQLGNVEAKIVVYLRRQDKWLESMYNEAISGSHIKECRPFSDFVEAHKDEGSIDYATVLSHWARVFGQDNIIVRPYDDELIKEGVVSDFCKVAGLGNCFNEENESASERNISPLAKKDLLVLRAMNKLPFDLTNKAASYRPFIHAFIDRHGSLDNTDRVRWFSGQARMQILKEFMSCNSAVVQSFLPEKSQELFSSPGPEEVADVFDDEIEDRLRFLEEIDFALELYCLYGGPRVIDHSGGGNLPVENKSSRLWPLINLLLKIEAGLKELFIIKTIRSSGLFDEEWYLKVYPDVSASGVDPVKHYVKSGSNTSRNPSSLFDSQAYLSRNEDVRNQGINPLYHYIKSGKSEGRVW